VCHAAFSYPLRGHVAQGLGDGAAGVSGTKGLGVGRPDGGPPRYARVSSRTQEIQSQLDALEASQVHRLFQECISTRVRERPEMKAALAAAREYRSLGAKVTLVVHEMKRLGRGALELLKVAEELRDAGIELEFLTGPLAGPLTGNHDPAGGGAALFAFFAAMAESERDYIRDKTLEGQETARTKGKAIGGVKVSDEDMLATALRLRDDEHLSLREIASRLVIRTGKKRGQHPSPATVMRMLREHDEQTATAPLEPAR
jgi:DNA invertase Pin-like site-specific DNA recombinase